MVLSFVTILLFWATNISYHLALDFFVFDIRLFNILCTNKFRMVYIFVNALLLYFSTSKSNPSLEVLLGPFPPSPPLPFLIF